MLCTTLAAAAIVLPLTFDDGNVYVAARIDDVPLRLIVDTGGKGSLQLTAAAISKVRLEMKPAVVTRIDAVGNEYRGRAFEVAELRIDDTAFHEVLGFVRGEAAGGLTGALPADGLIGMEFLRPYVARFDYRSNSLTLYREHQRGEAAGACEGRQVPVKNHPLRFWYSDATTDHGRFRMVWDSGATYSFVSTDVVASMKLPVADGLYETGKLILGATDYGPVDFVTVDLHVPEVDMLLGYNFFERHAICFDGPRSTVTVVN